MKTRLMAIGIVMAMVLTGLLVTSPPVNALPPTEEMILAGEDYVNLAGVIKSDTISKAGRDTASTYDGWDSVYDNKTWAHDFSTQDDLEGNGLGLTTNGIYDNYDSNGVTIQADGSLISTGGVSTYTDDFNDNAISSDWTIVGTPQETSQSLFIDNQQDFIYQNSTTNINNYTVNFYQDINSAQNRNYGPLSIYNRSAFGKLTTTHTNNILYTDFYVNMYYSESADDTMIQVRAKNLTNEWINFNNATGLWDTTGTTVNTIFSDDPVPTNQNYTFSIEYNATHVIAFVNSVESGWYLKATINRSILLNGTDTTRMVALGYPQFSLGGLVASVTRLGEYIDDFTMQEASATSYYQSPIIPTGANNSLFRRMTWTGNDTLSGDMLCKIRTANAPDMTGASAWHTVERNTSFVGSGWNGAFMQFNFTWVDTNANISNIMFYHTGSSNGIPWNGTDASTIIDRDTRWYGFNLSMNHPVNIHPPSGLFQVDFYLENCSIEANNMSINATSGGTVPTSIIYLSNNTINGSLKNSFLNVTGYTDYDVNMYNCSITHTYTVVHENIPSPLADIYNLDIFKYGGTPWIINSTGNVHRVHFQGGRNETVPGAPFDFFKGIRLRNGQYNYMDLTHGGNGITVIETTADALGTVYSTVTRNVIVGSTYWSIGIMQDWGEDTGIQNGTALISYNIIEGFNTSGGLWACGIHLRQDAENVTVRHNYIYDGTPNAVISAGILAWNGTRNNTIRDNFIWSSTLTAGILIWKDNHDIAVNDNFIYAISEGGYAGGDIVAGDGYGIVWWNNVANATLTQNSNVLISLAEDGTYIYGYGVKCGNDTMKAITGATYNVSINSTTTIWNGVWVLSQLVANTTSNYTFYQSSVFSYEGLTGLIESSTVNITQARDTQQDTATTHTLWMQTQYKDWGTDVDVNPTYTVTLTASGDTSDAIVTEDGVVIATTGNIVWTGSSNHTYLVTDTSLVADPFGLINDMMLLLIEYLPNLILLGIVLSLIAIMGALPIAFAVRMSRNAVEKVADKVKRSGK